MKIFAAHNPDSEIRYQSSAGGVFSMLAEKILSEGGVVYGVGFDNDWNIVHRRIDNPEDLRFLRGSKYAYSRIGTAIQDAISDLKSGKKVLFSGTPCQAAAMRKAGGDNPNLLIVEVVCHGAPEQKYWKKYLTELCNSKGKSISDILSINFRDKRTGWKNYSFTIIFNDGTVFTESHETNLYMQAFLKDLTLKRSCFECKFKYPNGSNADITLGDFWGIETISPGLDNNKGTTLVINRTDLNLEFLKDNNSRSYDLQNVSEYNPAITTPPKRKNINFEDESNRKGFIKAARKYTREPFILKIKKIISKIRQKIK